MEMKKYTLQILLQMYPKNTYDTMLKELESKLDVSERTLRSFRNAKIDDKGTNFSPKQYLVLSKFFGVPIDLLINRPDRKFQQKLESIGKKAKPAFVEKLEEHFKNNGYEN